MWRTSSLKASLSTRHFVPVRLGIFKLIFPLCEWFLPQNGNPQNPYCSGIEGVMEAYYQSLKSVRLYGPTHFSPVINHVARLVTAITPETREGAGGRGRTCRRASVWWLEELLRVGDWRGRSPTGGVLPSGAANQSALATTSQS